MLSMVYGKKFRRGGTLCRFALATKLQARVRYGAVLFYFQSSNQSSSKFTVDVHVIIAELRFTNSVV